jgi:hypothetical protein
MPFNSIMRENQKSSLLTMVVAAVVTLIGLSVLGAFNPRAMFFVAGGGFVFLLIRFVWLVWRELK